MQRARTVLSVMAMLIGLVVVPQQAHAVILNFGVDILSNGLTVQSGFYAEDPVPGSGVTLAPGGSYTLVLNTAAIFGGYTINSATLFVDANLYEASGSILGVPLYDLSNVKAQGQSLGSLADTPNPSLIPLVGGGTVANNDFDIDNTFFSLTGSLKNDLATDSTYQVLFTNTQTTYTGLGQTVVNAARSFRVEGINIQADATPIQEPDHCHTPEPASLVLFGMGVLGAGFTRRKKLLSV